MVWEWFACLRAEQISRGRVLVGAPPRPITLRAAATRPGADR
jgi:hypothetical protein